ncbi:ArsR family transcriptional regulator [Rothia sp. HC945]|uniref:ArsR family transcriptional regulator n=1 Tax=Rothia sp. HC945 TaxID=3171170 RepID=UPI003F26F1F1
MPRRVEDYRGLTQKSRLQVLHAVQNGPGLQLRELAEETDLHVNTLRDHLKVLEDEGFVMRTRAETGRRGRPPHGFFPVRSTEHSEAARDRVRNARRRGDAFRALEPELDHSDHIGSDAVHQIDGLYEHLDDAGLEPRVNEEDLTVSLLPCLYQDMLDESQPFVCSVHARLVESQLEQMDGPLELRRLHPFVEPRRCVIALGLRGQQTRSDRDGGVDPDQDDHQLESAALDARRAAEQRSHPGE